VRPRERVDLLDPDDLLAQREPGRLQSLADQAGVEGAMPHVGDRRVGQRVRLPPIRAVVVEERRRPCAAGRLAHTVPPGVVNTDPVRRVGHHHVHPAPIEQERHLLGIGRITAQQPVRPELVHLAQPRHRLRRRGQHRSVVLLGLPELAQHPLKRRLRLGQKLGHRRRLKLGQHPLQKARVRLRVVAAARAVQRLG
jgi:hypothetical protein